MQYYQLRLTQVQLTAELTAAIGDSNSNETEVAIVVICIVFDATESML